MGLTLQVLCSSVIHFLPTGLLWQQYLTILPYVLIPFPIISSWIWLFSQRQTNVYFQPNRLNVPLIR